MSHTRTFLKQSLSNYSIKYPSFASRLPLFCHSGSSSGRSGSSSCLHRSVPKGGGREGGWKFTFQQERLRLPCCASITWHKVPFSYYEPCGVREGVGVLITGYACPVRAPVALCPPCDRLSLATRAERLLKTPIRKHRTILRHMASPNYYRLAFKLFSFNMILSFKKFSKRIS